MRRKKASSKNSPCSEAASPKIPRDRKKNSATIVSRIQMAPAVTVSLFRTNSLGQFHEIEISQHQNPHIGAFVLAKNIVGAGTSDETRPCAQRYGFQSRSTSEFGEQLADVISGGQRPDSQDLSNVIRVFSSREQLENLVLACRQRRQPVSRRRHADRLFLLRDTLGSCRILTGINDAFSTRRRSVTSLNT